jgi:DNA-binding IclR family transcriptional regulator
MNEKTSALHKGLRVFKALKGHTLNGLSNQQLSQATGLSPTAITRVMQTMIEEGLAERGEDGRFRHSIAALQIAQAHAIEMSKAQDRINEINRRVSAGAQQ